MEQYRALFTVDAEKFSSHRDVQLPSLHMEIRHALDKAFAECGLGDAWATVPFLESTGDGVLAVLPLETLPRLIDGLVPRLQEALADSAGRLRGAGYRLRLRVALHQGLVDDERTEAPAISAATVDVCRLLDAQPLRDALAESDPEVTHLALLISRAVFETYVVGGRTRLRASQFKAVDVSVKQFKQQAFLWVPAPSRTEPAAPAPEATPPAPAPPATGGTSLSGITINGDGSRNLLGNTTYGDVRLDQK